jgi:hypothetical protein
MTRAFVPSVDWTPRLDHFHAQVGPVGLEPTTYGNLSGMRKKVVGVGFQRGLCAVAC